MKKYKQDILINEYNATMSMEHSVDKYYARYLPVALVFFGITLFVILYLGGR